MQVQGRESQIALPTLAVEDLLCIWTLPIPNRLHLGLQWIYLSFHDFKTWTSIKKYYKISLHLTQTSSVITKHQFLPKSFPLGKMKTIFFFNFLFSSSFINLCTFSIFFLRFKWFQTQKDLSHLWKSISRRCTSRNSQICLKISLTLLEKC